MLRPLVRPNSLGDLQTNARPSSSGSNSSFSSAPPSKLFLTPHTSAFRSSQLQILLHSSSIQSIPESRQTLPVYEENEFIEGEVHLDPSFSRGGRLTVTLEGTLSYSQRQRYEPRPRAPRLITRKHTFLSQPIYEMTPQSPPPSSSRLKRTMKRRPTLEDITSYTKARPTRPFQFRFAFPRSIRPGEMLPHSSASTRPRDPLDLTGSNGHTEISYRVTAIWESADGCERSDSLEAPLVYHPDEAVRSRDSLSTQFDGWLGLPLHAEKPVPYRCSVTIPDSGNFRRDANLPFYVVFSTQPHDSDLADEIATDSTISVSLVQHIDVVAPSSLPATPPFTPTASTEDFHYHSPISPLRRIARMPSKPSLMSLAEEPDSPVSSGSSSSPSSPPTLYRIPSQLQLTSPKAAGLLGLPTSFSDRLVMHNSIHVGFPNRPRSSGPPLVQRVQNSSPVQPPPQQLPDGLFKGEISLEKDMLASIDWSGVTVKYYLDVSVVTGLDELRARVPVQIN